MKNKKKLLTTRQVSEYLGIPLRTVQYLSQKAKIKSFKIGSRWKYLREDIERYLSFGTDISREPSRKPDDFTKRSDQRSHPRINSNFSCRYSISLPPYKEISNEGIVKNLSAGGIFLDSQQEQIKGIKISDPIDLDFSLINKDKKIDINTGGRIVRKDANGVGVKFTNMDQETRNKIIKYIG